MNARAPTRCPALSLVLAERPRPVFMEPTSPTPHLRQEAGVPQATCLNNLKKVGFPRCLPHPGGFSRYRSKPVPTRRPLVMQEKQGHSLVTQRGGRRHHTWGLMD